MFNYIRLNLRWVRLWKRTTAKTLIAMDFEVGSLANLISGNKVVSKSKENKLFSSKKEIVKFKTVKRKQISESEELRNNQFDDIKSKKSLQRKPNNDVKLKKIHKKEFGQSPGVSENTENETKKSKISWNAECAMKRLKLKKKKETEEENNSEYRREREIFVGNVPYNIKKKKLKRLFGQYGQVDTVRFRSAPVANPNVSKKVAVIKREFHPERTSMNAFIRFMEPESARKALEANGTVIDDHHIRVDLVANDSQPDLKKAVYLGNVPFGAEDEDLWKIFETCGNIKSIRIIRDRFTGVGKGFAYVNFESADAVELALKLSGTVLKKRELSVKRCLKKLQKEEGNKKVFSKGNKQNKSESRPKHLKRKLEQSEEGVDFMKLKPKKIKVTDEHSSENKEFSKKKSKKHKSNEGKKSDNMETQDSDVLKKKVSFKSSFQGQKTAEDKKLKKKKKRKINKGELKKISMAWKVSSTSKPSMKKTKKPTLKIKSAAKKMKLKPSSIK
ncbi:hypothetical protein L9F63_016922 [Diploptera punctata]|uniref:RRM domain-containing protein n=1 Tax=Diploptera punctata TaxID=6984 RepID=A0AAD8A034_DIPPU|nr:hypothetical protein L9F63_016922 [Diploptera punctata]